MGISMPRLILGGLVAGFVVNLGELAVNVFWLGDAWRDVLLALGLHVGTLDLVMCGLGSFVLGIVGVWIYAASRPRYGPGWRTALRAGLALWAVTFGYAGIGMAWMDAIPGWLTAVAVAWGLVEVLGGVYLGAWLYREGELAVG
jgi:hypothetical protein